MATKAAIQRESQDDGKPLSRSTEQSSEQSSQPDVNQDQSRVVKGLMRIDQYQLARGLGWFSIGLGLAEAVVPGRVAKLIGVHKDHNLLIRALGVRELAHGIGILSQKRPVEGVWSRVGGDAIDFACIGAAFLSPETKRGRLAAATAAVAGVALLDVLCAQQLSRSATGSSAIEIKKSITINRSPEELYQFWRDFQNLPRFMKHLESAHVIDGKRSHWVAKAPAGTTVEWDAEITMDEPNRLIAWRSIEGSDVDNSGSVRFEPATGGRGTVLRVEMAYNPPAGIAGAAIAKLFGEEPEQQVEGDLRRFKQIMETGEVVVSDGSLISTGYMSQRPAQPQDVSSKT
jgi:uncharacterized membrane protein